MAAAVGALPATDPAKVGRFLRRERVNAAWHCGCSSRDRTCQPSARTWLGGNQPTEEDSRWNDW